MRPVKWSGAPRLRAPNTGSNPRLAFGMSAVDGGEPIIGRGLVVTAVHYVQIESVRTPSHHIT